MRKKKSWHLLGGKDSQAYRDRHFAQSVFSQAAKDFKDYFRIPRYDLLEAQGRGKSFDYWDSWEPSANTKLGNQSPQRTDEFGGVRRLTWF